MVNVADTRTEPFTTSPGTVSASPRLRRLLIASVIVFLDDSPTRGASQQQPWRQVVCCLHDGEHAARLELRVLEKVRSLVGAEKNERHHLEPSRLRVHKSIRNS